MTTENAKHAANIAEKYGPYLTKAMKGEGVEDLMSLFASPVEVVLQSSGGNEILLSIGNDDNASMTWEEFQEAASKDLAAQDFARTESVCLGVLGNRFILEVARFNTAGEIYLVAYSLMEINSEGKIVAYESFSDVKAASLTGK